MKKFLRNSLSAVLASAVVFGGALGFAACGDDDGDTIETGPIASAEEWAAAMDFSDVTNGTLQISGIDGRVQTSYFDGDKVKDEQKNMDDTESSIRYIVYKQNEPHEDSDLGTEYCYKYNIITSTWIIEKNGMHTRDTLDGLFKSGVDYNLREYNEATGKYENNLSERYSDFVYDQSKNAYVASYARLGEMSNVYVEVKFEGDRQIEGTLSYVYEHNGQAANMKITFKIFDIGSTQFDLPQAEEE